MKKALPDPAIEKLTPVIRKLLQLVLEFFSTFRDPYTFNAAKNLYTLFGFAWGIPIPLVTLGLVIYTTGKSFNFISIVDVIRTFHFFWVFLVHPLIFYVVFGALGTMHKRREELIRRETVELERTKDQLIVKDRLAMVGQLAAGVAHEINNPACILLAKIGFQKSLLPISSAFTEQALKDLDKFEFHLLRVSSITQALLTFARQSVETTGSINLPALLDETLIFMEHGFRKNNVTLVKTYENQTKPFYGCSGELQQVFLNIISNALDAMSATQEGTLTVGFAEKQEGFEITIADTGTGIPSDIQDKIMEPFFSTKGIGKGTGLGLSISYGIITKHQGSINLSSEINKGTSFTISFPFKP